MVGMVECPDLLFIILILQEMVIRPELDEPEAKPEVSNRLMNHFSDVIEEHGHAFPLSPGLIPIVYFQNVEKVTSGFTW